MNPPICPNCGKTAHKYQAHPSGGVWYWRFCSLKCRDAYSKPIRVA